MKLRYGNPVARAIVLALSVTVISVFAVLAAYVVLRPTVCTTLPGC